MVLPLLQLQKINAEEVLQLQSLVRLLEENAQQGRFSIKEEQQIHLLMYQSVQNHLLTQYLDAFWQIYQQLDAELPAILISPTDLAMQYREWVDAIEARDLERVQRAVLYYFQAIRQRLTQGKAHE